MAKKNRMTRKQAETRRSNLISKLLKKAAAPSRVARRASEIEVAVAGAIDTRRDLDRDRDRDPKNTNEVDPKIANVENVPRAEITNVQGVVNDLDLDPDVAPLDPDRTVADDTLEADTRDLDRPDALGRRHAEPDRPS